MTPQPAGMVSCSHPLSSSLLISGSSSLSLSFLSSLSLARALAHALGLVTSRVLEDTIDTPTGSNGVLPSLCVSLSLSVFFSFCSRAFFDSSLFSRSLSLSRALSLLLQGWERRARIYHGSILKEFPGPRSPSPRDPPGAGPLRMDGARRAPSIRSGPTPGGSLGLRDLGPGNALRGTTLRVHFVCTSF